MESLSPFKNRLIVSCQATETEPLRDSYIMGKMALAAARGGAAGIRANGPDDIAAIKKEVDLPIIGILKFKYQGFDVFITPTIKEVRLLAAADVPIIAVDATKRPRPDGLSLEQFIAAIRSEFPKLLIMGDLSDTAEAVHAEKLGIDIIGTTLVGYTQYTKGCDPIESVRDIAKHVSTPIFAEGNIDTPAKARKALEAGAYAVVVGGAITRPMDITKKFISEMSLFQ